MENYKKITTLAAQDFIVKTNNDGSESWIPCDESNSDYQAYLAYVANGNTLPSNSADPAEKPKK